ncbi:MAG: hypothetical protein MUO22_02680, partial [Sedimentisphaerales bacterium]|nr:hypothetical protein [Sedimentisphaerales bacterium]
MVKTAKKTRKKQAKKNPTKKPAKTKKLARVKAKKAFSSYKQAMKYLSERTDYERQQRIRYNKTTFSLQRMQKLLTSLGNPHKKLSTVHIGGTKGKGSTATMLAKMLESNDYNVGLYTSP